MLVVPYRFKGALEPALAVRRASHGNLDAPIAQSSDTSGRLSATCPIYNVAVIPTTDETVYPFRRTQPASAFVKGRTLHSGS